ncbi:MAG: hypothetical protein DI562_10160 [Stenotrophomonas acidaminiphila]|nr:MAG: hypothetical protein DI562_10160 [Stenotrophomonas acidaminiphila]
MPEQYAHYPQYVPIVKWQEWEQRALKMTEQAIAPRVLPCIEVRDPKQHKVALKRYEGTWGSAALVDYANPEGKLSKDRTKELAQFLKQVKGSAALASPVLNPQFASSAFPVIKPVLGERKITLRVRLPQLNKAADHLAHLKSALDTPELADATDRLIVDLCRTPSNVSDEGVQQLVDQLKLMKALGFKHLHLASGAFPESLKNVDGATLIDRNDWKFWKRVAQADPSLLAGFSDYGPMKPTWTEEELNMRGGSVVLRYTLDDRWRVIRGSTKTKADSKAISELMVTTYKKEFKGATFSYGDQLIADRADPALPDSMKTGGNYHITEYWTHHIAHVVKQQY